MRQLPEYGCFSLQIYSPNNVDESYLLFLQHHAKHKWEKFVKKEEDAKVEFYFAALF